MDLWIRSQDRKLLIPIKDIITQSSNCICYDGNIIADYSTEKRALEVLDEIHRLIKGASNPSNLIFPTSITFEMPLE